MRAPGDITAHTRMEEARVCVYGHMLLFHMNTVTSSRHMTWFKQEVKCLLLQTWSPDD